MLPYALSIGLKYNEFWNMTLHQFRIVVKGENLKTKKLDEMMWTMGLYMQSATMTAIEHCFAKHPKSKYQEKPFLYNADLDSVEQEEIEQDEEIRRAERTFQKLQIMQANFNLKKERERRNQENEGGNE